MKPWFVKEADIIKFPEPEKKVIELPNVQSYPDFLTGVKDLHNRKAQGEISQDSHDRLYSDLINRFMKKESFETPWFLREEKNTINENILSNIKTYYNYIKNNWKYIKQAAIDFFKKKTPDTGKKVDQKPVDATSTTQAQEVPPGADQQTAPTGQLQQENVDAQTDISVLKQIQGLMATGKIQSLKGLLSHIKPSMDKAVQPIGRAIRILAGQSRAPGQVQRELEGLLIGVDALSYGVDEVLKAVTWLKGCLGPSDFDKFKTNKINILQMLKSKNPTAVEILSKNDRLLNLAKIKEGGGRGEVFLQILFDGKVVGGTTQKQVPGKETKSDPRGDIVIPNVGEFEVKANAIKEAPKKDKKTGEYMLDPDGRSVMQKKGESPAVFSGRIGGQAAMQKAAAYLIKNFQAGGFIKSNVKIGQKDKPFTNPKLVTKGSVNSWNMPAVKEYITNLGPQRAEKFLRGYLEILYPNLLKTTSDLLDKFEKNFLSNGDFNSGTFKKNILLNNANSYAQEKKFDGIIFLDVTSNQQDSMFAKVFEFGSVVAGVSKNEIVGHRTESFNAQWEGDIQAGNIGVKLK